MMYEADFERRAMIDDDLHRARSVMADPDLHSTASLIDAADILRNSPHPLDQIEADWFDDYHDPRDEARALIGILLVIIASAIIIVAVIAFTLSALGVTMADLDPTGTVAQVQHPGFDLERTITQARH